MGILSTLNGERFGTWTTVLAFLQDLNRRETGALAALNAALTAPADEQRELGEGEGALVLADIAGDLRVQKGSRLAAIRCSMEAELTGPPLATLFLGGGELATDPRLGASAKKLIEAGLPAALANPAHQASRVSMAAGAFARSAQAGASVVGASRLKELLAAAPPAHAGVNATLFALGQAVLPSGEIDAWKKLLREACQANRKAPAAAKRIGLAPPWPPNLPDAFKDLVADAEKYADSVVSVDAAKGGVIKGTAGAGSAAAPPPGKSAQAKANQPPIQPRTPSAPRAGSIGVPYTPGKAPPQALIPGNVPPLSPVQAAPPEVARAQPPLRSSGFRKPIGTVMEGPFVAPARQMPAVGHQTSPGTPRDKPTEQQASVPLPTGPTAPRAKGAPLPGLAPLPSLAGDTGPEFDQRGHRVPSNDRWRHDDWSWPAPILPSSELRPPQRALQALGPFALRLKSLFDGRPEAVERICAAAEARSLLVGEELQQRELADELALPRWNRVASADQLARLRRVESDADRPSPWRTAAKLLLERLTPKNEQ